MTLWTTYNDARVLISAADERKMLLPLVPPRARLCIPARSTDDDDEAIPTRRLTDYAHPRGDTTARSGNRWFNGPVCVRCSA